MHELDEIDMQILSLLADNARRPFSEIGEEVGLSGPAVSDRVTRLEDAGVLNGFTVDIDRSQIRAGVPVLVDLELSPDSVSAVRERLDDADAVEHVFVTAASDVRFYARVEARTVRTWLTDLLADVEIEGQTVTMVDAFEWTPSIDGVEFALTCAECSNTVDSEGETARIDGDAYHFCCASCLARFEQRYNRLEDGA
jgi:DNA-binding Lrp family transcriptional regulator